MAKPKPERVSPELAIKALAVAKDVGGLFSEYIVLHFRATGSLAPGCDNKDLHAWLQANRLTDYNDLANNPRRKLKKASG